MNELAAAARARPGGPGRVLREPLFWLVLQLVGTFVFLAWSGGLKTVRVADTVSYLNAIELRGLEEVLAFHRTFCYPLFLRTVIAMGRWLEPVATIQVVSYLGSIPLLWYSLKRVSGSGWLAWAAVFPLPFAGVVSIANLAQPDLLATVATIAAIACLLVLVAGPSRLGWWLGLGLAVFLAYQLRPAAVFLVGFVPFLGIVWKWLMGDRRQGLRWSLGLVATTVLPFVAFGLLRLAVVGHFGVVSFGGVNLAGLAANFLDAELVRELPGEHRPIAKGMLRLRRQRGWEAMDRDSVVLDHFKQYSDNIWDVALPSAMKEHRRLVRLPEGDPDRPKGIDRPAGVVRNDLLEQASRAILVRRPALYLEWVRGAILYGLYQLREYVWIVGPAVLLLFTLPLYGLRSAGRGAALALDGRVSATLAGLWVLGVVYFLGYLALVVVVSYPIWRYFLSMILFLPTMMSALLWVISSTILMRPVRG